MHLRRVCTASWHHAAMTGCLWVGSACRESPVQLHLLGSLVIHKCIASLYELHCILVQLPEIVGRVRDLQHKTGEGGRSESRPWADTHPAVTPTQPLDLNEAARDHAETSLLVPCRAQDHTHTSIAQMHASSLQPALEGL